MTDLAAESFGGAWRAAPRGRANGGAGGRAGGRAGARAGDALETGRTRLMITGVLFSLAFVAVAAKLVSASMLSDGAAPRLPTAIAADGTHGARAEITDRNGNILATTLQVASVFADPGLIIDPVEAADKLTAVLPSLDRDRLVADLSADKRFVWIKHGLTPRQYYDVNRLGLPGIAFHTEDKRIYPQGELTSHVVGFTDVDGRGLAGVERQFDAQLAAGGEPLALSIDMRLQSLLRDELTASIDEFSAIGGGGIIMSAKTGEVLAMVSLPDFNPYEPARVAEEVRFNRNTLGVYEMGSTFKIFNTAMALDSGVTTMSGGYDATQPIRTGRYLISDYHPERRWLSVPEIFMYSSNIGSVHMARAVGPTLQQEFLRRLGLMTRSPIELPEVGAPMVPSPWRDVTAMTVAFGHGMAVSPMNLVSGVAAMVNGGVLHPPTLVRRDPAAPLAGTRVIGEDTSADMRRLLRLVVEQGTGTKADAPGYLVGGKTGTAEKASAGGYDRKALMSSFVAAFPMTSPEYVVFVMLDEPKGTKDSYGYATGGWTAAPAIGRIIAQMGPMLGVTPVDADRPDIRDAMHVELHPKGSQLASVSE